MITEMQRKMGGWIVELVAPALIMLMTGSLAFFLVEVFYYGASHGRVKWVLTLFVFASVLTSRISIMEGFARATFFGLVLGAATLLVLNVLTEVSFALSVVFIGVIWWFNSKLTWDCTVIDQTKDSTDRGLLSRFGFNSDRLDSLKEEARDASDSAAALGTTDNDSQSKNESWTQRLMSRKKAPNTPGVWVLILSLAAFPIFGIGQGFIGDEVRRQNAFFDFCLYLIGGLGLLVTTAMVGLQRYLQKRNATMPNSVAITWVVSGVIMIGAILISAWMLPRPYSEYSFAENPFKLTRQSKWQSSRYAVGSEGKDDGNGGNQDSSAKKNKSGSGQSKDQGGRKSGSGKQGKSGSSKSGKGPSGKGKSGSNKSGKGRSNQKQSQSPSKGNSKSGNRKNSDPQNKSSPSSDQTKSGSGEKQSSSSSNKQDPSKSESKKQSSQSNQGNNQSGKNAKSQADSKRESESENSKQSNSSQQNDSDAQNRQRENDGRNRQQNASQRAGQSRKNDSEKNNAEKNESSANQKKDSNDRSGNDSRGSSSQNKSQNESQNNSSSSRSGSSSSSQQKSSFKAPTAGNIAWFVQLIFWIVVGVVLVVLAVKYRQQLWESFLKFLEDLKNFWANLFGKKKRQSKSEKAQSISGESRRPARAFASFADPYASGNAQVMTVHDLVLYSFEALQAWARERGCARSEDQTPHEFALELLQVDKSIARQAKKLADFYCTIAFADEQLNEKSVRTEVSELWRLMRQSVASDPVLQPA